MPEIASLQLFKILSDETRLGIVLLLREMGELCVCDLCTALEQSQPKTSRHLAMLRESGLLLDRKQGKWVHYRLSPHIPSWAALVIEQAWLSQQDDVQASPVSWHRPTALAAVRLFVSKNFACTYVFLRM